jgi:Acetamidase/Formamidase family
VFTDDSGVLTISTVGTCQEGDEEQSPPSLPPICASISRTEDEDDLCAEGSDSEEDPSTTVPSSATSIFNKNTMMMGLLSAPFLFSSRGGGIGSSLCAMALFSVSVLPSAFGQSGDACTPSLQIEISIPQEASVTSKFGETDHYLAATVDTVTWGYYDANATAQLTMESGETVTVEVITHHSGHDYAKMIRGDPAVEEIFYWEAGQTELDKPEPKLPGSGVHLVTGPIEIAGAEVGDVIQVDILELDPRKNPETGRCFGTNSQKFAGYQFRVGEKRDGTPYVRTGGTEAITVFEFIEDDGKTRNILLHAIHSVCLQRFIQH